jgi:hypothetical protein
MRSLRATHVGHGPNSATGLLPLLRGGTRKASDVRYPAGISRQGLWDHAQDGSVPKVAPCVPLGLELLKVVARLGLSLLITGGFAAGLSLYIGMPLSSPNPVRACEGLFFWTLALISCVTSDRS